MKIPKNYEKKVTYNNGEFICYKDITTQIFLLYSKSEDKIISKSKSPILFDKKIYGNRKVEF